MARFIIGLWGGWGVCSCASWVAVGYFTSLPPRPEMPDRLLPIRLFPLKPAPPAARVRFHHLCFLPGSSQIFIPPPSPTPPPSLPPIPSITGSSPHGLFPAVSFLDCMRRVLTGLLDVESLPWAVPLVAYSGSEIWFRLSWGWFPLALSSWLAELWEEHSSQMRVQEAGLESESPQALQVNHWLEEGLLRVTTRNFMSYCIVF